MTAEELRQKPIGVIERRSFTFQYDDKSHEESYWLGKIKEDKYFIGFSTNGSYCSNMLREKDMLNLINNKECSDSEAMDIYMLSPQLSCWME